MDGALEGYAGWGDRGEPCADVPAAGFAALLPMRALPRFTTGDLVRTLDRMVGGAGTRAELVPELTRHDRSPDAARVWHRPQLPPRVGVSVAGITLLVEGHDRPAMGAETASALGFRSWPGGEREVARARAHVRVFEAQPALGADLDVNHDRAAAVTAAAVAALELTQAVGIVWETSGVAVPAAEMLSAVPALVAGEPPTALWIGAGSERWGTVATRGLYSFLGAEVELRAPALSQTAAEGVITGVAAEILETGQLPAEGTLIEHGSHGAFCVRYRGSEDGASPAILLEESGPGVAWSNDGAPAVGAA